MHEESRRFVPEIVVVLLLAFLALVFGCHFSLDDSRCGIIRQRNGGRRRRRLQSSAMGK